MPNMGRYKAVNMVAIQIRDAMDKLFMFDIRITSDTGTV